MTAAADPPSDARRRPRPRVAMSGKIIHGLHHEVSEVVVRNMTEGGAKVRLTAPNRMLITGRLVLRISSGDREAVVAWQSGDEIGLRFEPA
ncbi:MAG: PilZ domain-containing protein [Brevundimonas sp.]